MKSTKILTVLLLLVVMVFALSLSACAGKPGGSTSPAPNEPDNSLPNYDSTGGTLTQEQNIDEGDIVKMYDDVIYKLQSDGVVVYRVNQGTFSLIGQYTFSSERHIPIEMYVTTDKIVAIYGATNTISGGTKSYLNNFKQQDYTRALVSVFKNPTAVNDAQEPIDLSQYLLYNFEIQATYIASRSYVDSGETYFAFSYTSPFEYTTTDDVISTQKTGKVSFKENGTQKTVECASQIEGIDELNDKTITLFMRINLKETIDNCTIGGLFGATLQDIYMSETSIIPIFNYQYVERVSSGGGCYGYSYSISYSDAYCLKLNPETLKVVDGVCLKEYTVYDRRAIKDFGDVIYITATKQNGTGSTVIALSGQTFSYLNKLESIAPNENVKSVAYEEVDGKRYCYVTTFRQTDPLFKVDVTNPYAMQSLGYLKITGYSTFMLPVGNRLLTIGYADDSASEFYPSRMRVAIYDTSGDSVLPIDERFIDDVIYCEALTDPRVIAVHQTVFAFACVTKQDGEYYQGLYIFQVIDDSIEFIVMLTNLGDDQNKGYVSTYSIPMPDGNGNAVFSLSAERSYAFSITRARYYDGYVYTMSDAIMTSHKVSVDQNGLITVDQTPTEKIYTALKTDYEQIFKAKIEQHQNNN